MNHLNSKTMEAFTLLEKNTACLVKSEYLDKGMMVSAVIDWNPVFSLWKNSDYIPAATTEMIGTTVEISKPIPTSKTNQDEYELDYDDDYEVVAKAPIIKSFKIKAKIKSVSRFQPKVFID
jgi:hypothetical protein